MWTDLPEEQKTEYKRMILAFASLSEMFAQKSQNNTEGDCENENSDEMNLAPIINSKYQETVFQRVFSATPEDIDNTSFDVSIEYTDSSGRLIKSLVGIKTFGIKSGAQKIAQFKQYNTEWSSIVDEMNNNSFNEDGSVKTKSEINEVNENLYLDLATRIANLRNTKIRSDMANLQGFTINEDDIVESIYHVLMPSGKNDPPAIHVGEINYDPIDIDHIQIKGCSRKTKPAIFSFTDGNHDYRFSTSDCQLFMNFNNTDIILDTWDVRFIDDAYSIFSNIADQVYKKDATPKMTFSSFKYAKPKEFKESYSWFLTNEDDEVELFSGFNSFYGIGSKMGYVQREKAIKALERNFIDSVNAQQLNKLMIYLKLFLLDGANSDAERKAKVELRKEILDFTKEYFDSTELNNRVKKLLFRPQEEMYIPIPNSATFHSNHPNFFCDELGVFSTTTRGNPSITLNPDKSKREFNLVFDPSGNTIKSYIVEDSGKAIQSVEKQSYLGEWILRGVFQLKEYEPLTAKRLKEIGINGIRLWKSPDNKDIHLNFIWIDRNKLPNDFFR